tara:strand:- start:53 stop:457 length:405 start_codon:yes stop_codon:yes gene_type:complete
MAKNTHVNSTDIANLSQLENVLGVKMDTKTTTNKTLSEKAQVMKQVNDAMHKLLIEKFPQYYKNIESDVIVTSKENEHRLIKVSGYHLLFAQDVQVGNDTQKGFAISKPTIYVKGGNSYKCLYFKEIGKTTYTK